MNIEQLALQAGFKIKNGIITDGRPFSARLNDKLHLFALFIRNPYETLLADAANHVADARRYRTLRAIAGMTPEEGAQYADILEPLGDRPGPDQIDAAMDACMARNDSL